MNTTPSHLYDRFLVLRCQAGDPSALAELISRFSPALHFFLRKMTGTAPDDLLQETWFDVYRTINRLQHPEAFPAWLYSIARNKAYAHLRRPPPPPSLTPEHLAETPAPNEDTFSPDEAQSVRSALDSLPDEHREVLTLRFLDDLTYDQIAQVIACPVGTVRSRIHYAKRALREKLTTTPFNKGAQP